MESARNRVSIVYIRTNSSHRKVKGNIPALLQGEFLRKSRRTTKKNWLSSRFCSYMLIPKDEQSNWCDNFRPFSIKYILIVFNTKVKSEPFAWVWILTLPISSCCDLRKFTQLLSASIYCKNDASILSILWGWNRLNKSTHVNAYSGPWDIQRTKAFYS